MSSEVINLAFDYGASSGRLVMSRFDGEKISIEEIYRFPNEPVRLGDNYYWDFLRLFHELKMGLKKAAHKNVEIAGIGIDTWGVDYGFLDEYDNLISNPLHYRDNRTDNIIKDVETVMPFQEIYSNTGIQYLQFNTLFQLYADRKFRPNVLNRAKSMLFMPDLFNFYLTGKKYNEYTIASTGQMLNAQKKTWDLEIINKLDLPTNILQDIIMPGEICGNLTEAVQREVGLKDIPVIAVGSHDTASAVAGTPIEGENSAYLSCGTWSLLGIESKEPIINDLSLKNMFTNEGGVNKTIRFLTNINGLWILQQLRKHWSENVNQVSFPDIIKAAASVKNNNFIINPNDKSFMAPLNMADAIKEYCKNNGQGVPYELGEIAIAIYNGITNEYKYTVDKLEETIGKQINTINMVGGGIQDEFLCQLTANVTGRKVLAGPIEASVLGNILVQLMALGKISSLSEGRQIIKNSFTQKEYIPQK